MINFTQNYFKPLDHITHCNLKEVAKNLNTINFNLWKNLVIKAADLGHVEAQNMKKSWDT